MQLRVKTLLNLTHPISGFTYTSVALIDAQGSLELAVTLKVLGWNIFQAARA